jgi:hypothetical protein
MNAQRLLPVPLLSLLFPLLLSTASLGAQEAGASAGAAPRLSGILDLDSLSLLWHESQDSSGYSRGDTAVPSPEPLDIASTAEGPVILFADRIISLGVNLEMTTRTVQDLIELPQPPDGVLPSRLLFNPLSEPIIYDARNGTLVLLHRGGGNPERFETELPQAVEAESLRRGGVLLSDGKGLSLFTRNGDGLTRREIPLPIAFTTGLSTDREERLWIYDLAARQVRVYDLDGKQLFSITPEISGATLLFPQIFQARPDGGFFLGSAGELWCFKADGSVRWRLSQFSAGIRQALPAFYRLAAERSPSGSIRSFYILDPLGNRILKFIEDLPGNSNPAPGIGPVDTALARAFQGSDLQLSGENEILRLCLEQELYLQAAFFRRAGSDEPVVTDLPERLLAKQAGLVAKLAEELEYGLRYTEAESAYNRALILYRELRNLDPVDPRYPETIRELSGQRNSLRQIRVGESLLEARRLEGGLTAGAENPALRIALVNGSDSTVNRVEVLAGLSGYSSSRWRSTLETLRPGGTVVLTIPLLQQRTSALEDSTLFNAEDLSIPCNLLVRYVQSGKTATESLRLPLIFPAGTLPLRTDG